MRRIVATVVVGVLTLAALGFGGAYWYVAHPPDERRPLPDRTVSLRTERGTLLLEKSRYRADLQSVQTHFRPQIYRSYCGVATAATLLRASGRDIRQENFFDSRRSTVMSGWDVFFSGLTLAELAEVLEARGSDVDIHYASDSSPSDFRHAAKANLGDDSNFLVVNYGRSAAAQEGGGHISPVVAYHGASDRLLVYDTADYKYPPFWISLERLFAAMDTVDEASGRTRGFLTVRP